MMANADATAEAIEIAREMPTLGTGCHIVLTDGAPILRPDQVPQVRKALDHYRQVKETLEEISELNQQMLRLDRDEARSKGSAQ